MNEKEIPNTENSKVPKELKEIFADIGTKLENLSGKEVTKGEATLILYAITLLAVTTGTYLQRGDLAQAREFYKNIANSIENPGMREEANEKYFNNIALVKATSITLLLTLSSVPFIKKLNIQQLNEKIPLSTFALPQIAKIFKKLAE